jgi:hypothetical protein
LNVAANHSRHFGLCHRALDADDEWSAKDERHGQTESIRLSVKQRSSSSVPLEIKRQILKEIQTRCSCVESIDFSIQLKIK